MLDSFIVLTGLIDGKTNYYKLLEEDCKTPIWTDDYKEAHRFNLYTDVKKAVENLPQYKYMLADLDSHEVYLEHIETFSEVNKIWKIED